MQHNCNELLNGCQKRRLNNGYWQGGVPFGLTFDDAGQYHVPGTEFQTALTILDDREQGLTYREIAQRQDVSKDTVSGVLGHAEEYQRLTDDESARIGYDWQASRLNLSEVPLLGQRSGSQ